MHNIELTTDQLNLVNRILRVFRVEKIEELEEHITKQSIPIGSFELIKEINELLKKLPEQD